MTPACYRRTGCRTTCSLTRRAPPRAASRPLLPVLGVPVAGKHLQGEDALHSIVQMPKGIPVATFAIGTAGAANAALFAVAMLANEDVALRAKLEEYRARQTEAARNMSLPGVPPTASAPHGSVGQ